MGILQLWNDIKECVSSSGDLSQEEIEELRRNSIDYGGSNSYLDGLIRVPPETLDNIKD